MLTASFIALLFPCCRLSAYSRGSALRGFTAAEKDQAREEVKNLVSEVICVSVSNWYVNVSVSGSFGALLLFHVELQSSNKLTVKL